MRRALAAVALTVGGLVALLDYRSGTPASARSGSAATPTSAGATAPTTTKTTTPTTTPAPGSPPTSTTVAAATATGEEVSYRYGDIEVRVSEEGGTITSVTVPEADAPDFRSSQINSQAIPELTSEALAAQGSAIDAVSGATYTSDAFIQSLQSALAKVAR